MKESTAKSLPRGVLRVRSGPGANCSSIGSAVDALFVAAVGGSAVFVILSAIAGAKRESGKTRDETTEKDDG